MKKHSDKGLNSSYSHAEGSDTSVVESIDVADLVTDGGVVEEENETLRLTDDGLEMPEFLKGYVGQFTLRTADITGQYTTTDAGLPTSEFYDGVIAAYPDDGGDYNSHLRSGLMSLQTSDHEEVVYEIVDERTDGGSE